MKTIRYILFLLFVLLSVDGYAQSKQLAASPRIGGYDCPDFDLREIFEPIVIHETFDTKNGRNVFGNDNNEVCFAFTLYRPAVFLLNCNGSSLEQIDAHLLYYPLDESADDFVDVSDPIAEDDYDEIEKRIQMIQYMNVLLEENILHGWCAPLLQILQPGHYVLYCEGSSLHGTDYNGEIRSNIYINPVGASSEMPMDIGYYSEDFDYNFSGLFEDQDSNQDLYFSMHLDNPMHIFISSKDTQGCPLSIEIMDETGKRIAISDDYPLENDSFPQIAGIQMAKGAYLIHFTYEEKVNMNLNISGKLNLLKGDRKEDPIQIATLLDKIEYQETLHTGNYSNFYYPRDTKDVFHRFVTTTPMNILISAPYCYIKEGAMITVLNENNQIIGALDTRQKSELLLEKLAPGTYYIVSEGNKSDGEIILCVQGDKYYAYAPSANRNYITTITPLVPVSTGELLNDPNKALQQVDYYDLLGRPEQTVLYGASPTLRDFVTYTEYDGLGRKSKEWLPITKTLSAAYVPLSETASNSSALYSDTCAYDKFIYENSPLSRIVENYGAGETWQNTGHSVKSGYRTNTKRDHCRHFKAGRDRNSPVLSGYTTEYPAYELKVEETEDEDGHVSYHFTDNQGNPVLERVIADTDTLDTYYVYDDYANLCFVLPPIAVDSLITFSQDILDRYAYQYRYDYRNRCIGKKLPGCSWVESIYDRADRLLFTQDGEQRKRNEWSVSLSDLLGRPVIAGIYKGLPDRAFYEQQSVYAEFTPDSISTCYGYTVDGLSVGSIEILRVDYFDTYDYKRCNSGFTPSLGYLPNHNPKLRNQHNGEYFPFRGLLTGSMTTVLESGQKLFSCTYYDFNQRPIQVRSTTINGTIITLRSTFDFTGKVTDSQEEYNDSTTVQKHYVYDHAGRLIKEIHSLNRQDSIHFTYVYDELGRMKSLTRSDGAHTFTTENTYNIRGWLTTLNSPQLTQTLHYTDGAGTPRYNGSINSMTWKTEPSATRGYTFTYDGLSRLKDAVYSEGDELRLNPNRFNEQITGYDKQGNILGLKRYGQISETEYGLIDNLKMNYAGNQLQAVKDNAVSSVYGDGFEFKNGENKTIEYKYDTNGNLTKDLNKNMTDIQYNCLNLPSRIQFSGGSTISYHYSADGAKLRTIYTVDGKTATTDCCGNAIYENGSLDKLLTGQGYITLADTMYHYFLQDHQGSNRVIVAQNGTVEEVNHYYPSGGVFGGSSSVQPYKYNGKGLDRSSGLNWYDYGARMYDATLGRWHAVDPMAEMYHSSTPYSYCGGDPVNRVDPTGMDYWSTNDPEQIRQFLEASKSFPRNSGSYLESFNFSSWNHSTDGEFLSNLTFNDETNMFYSSYGTVEDGVATRVGFSVPALKRDDKNAWIEGPQSRWLKKASGRVENVYPEFELLTALRGLLNVAYKSVAREVTKELPSQIHHFATNKHSVFTNQMSTIAKKYSLDLDGAWNKAAMPHLGRHPNAYHKFVLQGMERASLEAGGNQTRFLQLFDKYVKQTVLQNPNLLRKSGW